MFERLTKHARQVILGAVQSASTLRAENAGPLHLMVALANTTDSRGARVLSTYGVDADALNACLTSTSRAGLTDDEVAALRTVGIDADEVFRHLEDAIGPEALTEASAPQPRRRGLLGGPFSREGRKVIELALREAIALGQKRKAGSEHLLLALLRHGLPDPMRTVLTEHTVTYDDARQRVLVESRKAA